MNQGVYLYMAPEPDWHKWPGMPVTHTIYVPDPAMAARLESLEARVAELERAVATKKRRRKP